MNVIDERLRLYVCCCHEEDVCKFTTLTLPIRCYEEVVESKKEAIRELVAYAGDCEGHRPLHYQPISDK